MNKMFRERNPLPLGLAVVVALLLVVLTVLNINGLVDAFGRQYRVMLPEAAGLKQGDPVRVSGLHVGRVGTVRLSGDGVLVEFSVTDAHVELGDQTTAEVSVETVLGDKALQLTSAGTGALAEGATIPMERASVPYDVTDALSDLQQESSRIDVRKVATALDAVAGTVDGATPQLRSALEGVSRLSATINSRDATLRSLLSHADQFSRILADRSDDMTALVRDGNVLFGELLKRRDDISSLLTNLSTMSRELTGLVHDNNATLGPALDGLNRVMGTLQQNKRQLSEALRGMSVYVTGLGEVVSSGPFFTAYLQNLLPGNMLDPDLSRLDPSVVFGTTHGGGQ
ncbi:MAG TPA: MCE family protein [Nocardioides sp.]|nr:MCE family protein [Nocardioides sp.]